MDLATQDARRESARSRIVVDLKIQIPSENKEILDCDQGAADKVSLVTIFILESIRRVADAAIVCCSSALEPVCWLRELGQHARKHPTKTG